MKDIPHAIDVCYSTKNKFLQHEVVGQIKALDDLLGPGESDGAFFVLAITSVMAPAWSSGAEG
jgi:hypothetical protein